jgi:hypothetical protein
LRLKLRANGFVFTHSRSQIHVKASSVDRQLAKTALEARLGSFVASGHEQRREETGVSEKACVLSDRYFTLVGRIPSAALSAQNITPGQAGEPSGQQSRVDFERGGHGLPLWRRVSPLDVGELVERLKIWAFVHSAS